MMIKADSKFHMAKLLNYGFFLICLVVFSGKPLLAQNTVPDRRAKAVYGDVLGNNIGSGPSLNFDMRFKKTTNIGFGAKIGFGTKEEKRAQYYRVYHMPLGLYYVQGTERLMLESGIGMTVYRTVRPYQIDKHTGARGDFKMIFHETEFFGNLGLRLQPKRNGLVVRFYWAPFLEPGEYFMRGPFGLSIGAGFK